MVTMTTAQDALKTVYLSVVSEQLNTRSDPLLSMITQSTADVYGRSIQKLVPYGINGGVGAGTEDGKLPESGENKYLNFTTTLKNLYGSIEITDKAIRASANDSGAFVDLLTAEMDGLLNASKFNLSRMLYGDGTGVLSRVTAINTTDKTIQFENIGHLMEGITVDVYVSGAKDAAMSGARVVSIDRGDRTVKLDKEFSAGFAAAQAANIALYVQNSKDRELTGIGAIFSSSPTLYGVSRDSNPWLAPHIRTQGAGETFSELMVQGVIDEVEFRSNTQVDIILCGGDTRAKFMSFLLPYRKNLDFSNLNGGVKSLSFNGIPVVVNRFVNNGVMLFLNSKDFTLHQLCDWEWLAHEDGSILKQKEDYPIYKATLVKYADLICSKPGGQGMLRNIS